MGKKMKLPFLSQSKSLDPKLSSPPPWPWPACGNIKTLSFRAQDDAFRTFNSAYLDTEMTPPGSFFTVTSSSRSLSTMSEDFGDPVESVIRGLRSDRLFFEPEQSSSLVMKKRHQQHQQQQPPPSCMDYNEESKISGGPDVVEVAYKESEVLSMDSNNPYDDFRRSMEEMVDAHELKDWQGFEELLGCYLKINGKNNHGYIIGAFIDLLVSLSFTSTSTTTTTTTTAGTSTCSLSSSTNNLNYSSPSSPLSLPSSSLTTPCLSSILDHGDDDHDGDDVDDDDDRCR